MDEFLKENKMSWKRWVIKEIKKNYGKKGSRVVLTWKWKCQRAQKSEKIENMENLKR